MTTKFEDAATIASSETVEKIEKELSLEMLEKSQVEELVIKSLATVDQSYADIVGKNWNTANENEVKAAWVYVTKPELAVEFSPETLKSIQSKLVARYKEITGNSEIMVSDELAKSEAVEKIAVKMEDDMGEMDTEDEYKPLGGATSLADAQKYLDAKELQEHIYEAYALFGAVSDNILCCADMDANQQLIALQKLVADFKNLLTPEKLKELSMAETPKTIEKPDVATEQIAVKSELDDVKTMIAQLVDEIKALKETRSASVVPEVPVVSETPEVKSEILPISKEFDGLLKESLSMTGENRKAAMQNILNRIGETFTQMEKEISKSETPVNGGTMTKDEVKNIIANELQTVTAQIAALTQLIQNQAIATKSVANPITSVGINLPVQKSITHLPQMPVTQVPSKGMSIADIVRKTTTG